MRRFILILLFSVSVLSLSAQEQNDWANHQRFAQDNTRLKSNPIVILIGDSILELWDSRYPDFFREMGWLSRAISGQTTTQMLARFKADVIDLKPKVIVIAGGTNDLAQNTGYMSIDNIMDNIISMVELARVHKIRPVLCTVLPVDDYPWRQGLEPAPKIVELNNRIKEYAQREKITVCDYSPMTVAHTVDGVHPSKEGYEIMRPILLDAVTHAKK